MKDLLRYLIGKRPFIKLYLDGVPGYVVPVDDNGLSIIASELENAAGENYGPMTFQVVWAWPREIEKAPEFEGW